VDLGLFHRERQGSVNNVMKTNILRLKEEEKEDSNKIKKNFFYKLLLLLLLLL
jgi:hypothetical protein